MFRFGGRRFLLDNSLMLVMGFLFILTATASFIPLTYTFAEERSRADIHDAGVDGKESKLFLLHKDSTVSVYDLQQEQFIALRRPVAGLTNAVGMSVSRNGDWAAIIKGGVTIGDAAEVFFIPTSDLLAGSIDPNTILRMSIGLTRGATYRFSPDSRTFIIANTVQGKIQVIDPAGRRTYEVDVGQAPSAMAFDATGTRLFVSNTGDNSITAIDLKKREVLASVPVGVQPIAILYNAAQNRIFVSNVAAASVTVIDASFLKVLKEVSVGNQPGSLAYDPDTGLVFVANNGDGTLNVIEPDFDTKTIDLGAVAYYQEASMRLFYARKAKQLLVLNQTAARYLVYDPETERIIKEGRTDVWPKQLHYSEEGNRVFIRHFEAPILMIDLASFQEERISGPAGVVEQKTVYFSSPQSIAIDEDSNTIYVSNHGSGTIAVIDGNTHKPTTVIPVAQAPQAIALNPVTKKLYVSSPVENTVTVIDTTTAYPKKIIAVEKGPRSPWINTTNNKVYVPNSGSQSVSVIDGSRDEVIKTISLAPQGVFPLQSAINERKNEVYVANYGGDTVAVIDGATDTLKRFISVGRNPIWVRYLPKLDQLYVAVEGEKKVLRIDPATYEIVESFVLEKIPYRIFFDKETSLVYVNHRRDETLTVIKPAESQSGRGTIIAEPTVPYYGQTDTIYNMLYSNSRTGLVYVTYGKRNQVIVIRINRAGPEQILQPTWFATIQADGTVLFNPELQAKAPSGITRKYFLIIVGGLAILIGLTASIYWFLRKKSQQIV